MGASVLVADIGGTNVRFAVASLEDEQIKLSHITRYPVADFESFDAALTAYNQTVDDLPKQAAFAFAGPKFDDKIRMTNTSWLVGQAHLKAAFGFERVALMNDFAGMALGAVCLSDASLESIIKGDLDHSQNIAVTGPGTGLGLAGVLPDTGQGRVVVATEGGHVAFAPQSKMEIEVLAHLLARHEFVSAEMILSGDGFYRLYSALCAVHGVIPKSKDQTHIIPAALADKGSIAFKTVQSFCNILGGYAGSAALMLGASGGLVLSGGVTAHIAPFISGSEFKTRFLTRAGGTHFVEHIAVKRITQDDAALYGAASVLLKS